MTDPPLQYARSADGASIAFRDWGSDGPPLLMFPGLGQTVGFKTARDISPVLNEFRMAFFNRRGSGHSTRTAEMTLDRCAEDCVAMADAMGWDSFHVNAGFIAAFDAVRLAVRFPERVRSLVLNDPVLPGFGEVPPASAWRAALDVDWDWFVEAFVSSWGTPEPGQAVLPGLIEHFKANNDVESFRAVVRMFTGIEDSGLEQVRMPTLIIHNERFRRAAPRCEAYARGIPGARLVVSKGTHSYQLAAEATDAMREFYISTLRPEEVPLAWRSGEVVPTEAADESLLSAREREVLRLIAGGRSNAQIAAALTVSLPTVATHLRHIFEKVGVENRAGAAAWAVREGLG